MMAKVDDEDLVEAHTAPPRTGYSAPTSQDTLPRSLDLSVQSKASSRTPRRCTLGSATTLIKVGQNVSMDRVSSRDFVRQEGLDGAQPGLICRPLR